MRAKVALGVIAILVSLGFVACSSGGLGGPTLFPGTGVVARFLFVVGDSNIAAFTVNTSSGSITPVSGSPFGTLQCPDMAAANPAGTFLFVPDACAPSGIAVFAVSPTGTLAPATGSPLAVAASVQRAVVDCTGQFLYVTDSDGNVRGFKIAGDGSLTAVAGTPVFAGPGGEQLTINCSGSFLYVAAENGIVAYSINPSTGELTAVPGSPFVTPLEPRTVLVGTNGRFLYANVDEDTIQVFSIGPNGALTLVGTASVPDQASSNDLAMTPNCRFLYAVNRGDLDSAVNGSVSAFKVDPATGLLSQISGQPFTAGDNPRSATVDPSGKFLYVTNEDAGEIIDHPAGPDDPGAGGLSVFSINQDTGALTEISGSPFKTNVGPETVTITSR